MNGRNSNFWERNNWKHLEWKTQERNKNKEAIQNSTLIIDTYVPFPETNNSPTYTHIHEYVNCIVAVCKTSGCFPSSIFLTLLIVLFNQAMLTWFDSLKRFVNIYNYFAYISFAVLCFCNKVMLIQNKIYIIQTPNIVFLQTRKNC